MDNGEKKGKAIGIDLGTTWSAMAWVEAESPEIIPNSEGQRTTPSVVAFEEGALMVGELARRQAVANPDWTVRSIKRHMGDKDFLKRINGSEYKPQEISAFILKKLKKDAESFFGQDVTQAVITVPAYFNAIQKEATREAGEIAGLEVLRIIDEPTAAAVAYGHGKEHEKLKKLLVFDFGGGTFDVSILKVVEGVISVAATSGDNFLGGDDLDKAITEHLAAAFEKENGAGILEGGAEAAQRLRDAAEEAKWHLSTKEKTRVSIPYLVPEKALNLNVSITRAEFEGLIGDLIKRTREPIFEALKEAGMEPADIDVILLVGGSTRIPRVKSFVAEIFGKSPSQEIHPDECVALGAAILADRLSKGAPTQLGGMRNTRSLGVELHDGSFAPIIKKGKVLPARARDTFTTVDDNQPSIRFPIYQGESATAAENDHLDELFIEGVREAPKGVPRIEVTFVMSEEGTVEATAKDLDTGVEADKVTFQGSTMSAGEISEAAARVEQMAEKME